MDLVEDVGFRNQDPLSDAIEEAYEDGRVYAASWLSPTSQRLATEARDYAMARADALEARVAELKSQAADDQERLRLLDRRLIELLEDAQAAGRARRRAENTPSWLKGRC